MLSTNEGRNKKMWNEMSEEERQKVREIVKCSECDNEQCIHRNAFRAQPRIMGGLGLCPKLKGERE